MALVSAFALLCLAPWTALAATVHVRWDVGYVYMDRNGKGVLRSIGVNGTLPVPPVYITEGDTLELQIYNMLDVPTSVHAHGVFQNGTAFMDGPNMVSQCGIPPSSVFTYSYVVEQSGLFWLHGHTAHQNAAGLRAPLVVRDRETPPYAYDGEQLLWFEDWYPHEFDARVGLTIHSFPPPVTYPSALVNGYDGARHMPALRLAFGKTYRIQLINISITESFRFSVPGYELRVIEVDGYYSLPSTVDGVDLGPGQRYSVLVTAPLSFNKAAPDVSVYKVELYADFIPQRTRLNPLVHYGPIHYTGSHSPCHNTSEIVSIDTHESERMVWANDIHIQGLANKHALPVDRQIKLNIGGTAFTDRTIRDIINNITYAHAKVPTLYSVLTLPDALVRNSTLYGPQTHSVVLDHLQAIELLVRNVNFLSHPMHLHGHRFQVVEYGPIPPNERPSSLPLTADNPQMISMYRSILDAIAPVVANFERPMERDTVVVPPMQYVKIRFRADNPGVWLFHCHMDIHFAMGMAMTFIEAPEVLRQSTTVPKVMLDMCDAQGIKSSGNAVGSMGTDLAGLPAPPTMVPAP
ncbi:ferroxidase fet3 [Coemansia sp. RSA 1813]|nr:ferroxidase fet3 [Coemansia sp. RSA 1646]KAJ2086210.1 ferroxidase fet3 [Coemansia sp. RSA 986]KAJ2212950.1 ferroxidase fet3 [Coemansia sp. RSA 487]KAJ2567626.1 ferroxidase fet3 [Coemansia sp. RSA 1813]